jgi:hypothetical protein
MLPIALKLIATALPEMLDLFSTDNKESVADKVIKIATSVTNEADPEQAVENLFKNKELMIEFKSKLLDNKTELEKIKLQRETLYVSDVQDARKYRDQNGFYIAVGIYIVFLITVCMMLYGGYQILVVGKEQLSSELIAVVASFAGTLLGYVASQAQLVSQFYFGSSYMSMSKSDEMADALKKLRKV